MNKPFRFKVGAFSLIELLTVVSVVSLLAVFVGPALSSLSGASGTTRAVVETSGVLEHARQSALRLSTWVWVGIADTSALHHGLPTVSLIELASRDGSSDISPSNLMALRRTVHVRGVRLVDAPESGTVVLGTQGSGLPLRWELNGSAGRQQVDFTGRVIGFSPLGEAVVEPGTIPGWIKIPFQASANPVGHIAVQVSGPSGQVVMGR